MKVSMLLQHSLTIFLVLIIQCCCDEHTHSHSHSTESNDSATSASTGVIDFFASACSVPSSSAIKPFNDCTQRADQTQHILNFHHNFTEFTPLLVNRTLVMIGDSTMHNQFVNLCENFKAAITIHNLTSICQFNGNSSTISFLAFGRKNNWIHSCDANHMQLIANTTSRLSERDVILFGVGVHWHYVCGQRFPAGKYMENFEYALTKLMELLPLVKKNSHCSGRCCVGLQSPTIIFRESFPQHFLSSNGQYPVYPMSDYYSLLKIPLNSPKVFSCPPLTRLSSSGAGLLLLTGRSLKKCIPNCLPSTWQNDVANYKLQNYCVDTHRIFNHLECIDASGQHNNGKTDCTHYRSPIHSYVNYQLVLKITTGSWKQ